MQPAGPRSWSWAATGLFGGKLAGMLLDDGWDVMVTSRTLARVGAFAAKHGGHPLALARDGALAAAFAGHGIVVDAAGPWQDAPTTVAGP